MASRHTNSINIKSDGIYLDDFVIDEPKLINYFIGFRDKNELEQSQIRDKLIHLLYLGYLADKSVQVGEKVDYVKEGFDALKQDMGNQIKNNFSESMKNKLDVFLGTDGSFTKELQDTFGSNGAHNQKITELIQDYKNKIESMLDINDENSPLKALEKSFEEKFTHIQNFMSEHEGTKKAEEKSTQKGIKFEDFVSPILSESAVFFNCTFERTSGVKGALGDKNSKKGDFVLTEKDTNKKIVLETKNWSKDPTTKQILEYSRLAIENRVADYCVYIYCDSDDLTVPEAGMFSEISKNILFVTVSETDLFEAQQRIIRLGCSWALQRIKADNSKDAELNEKLKKMQGILRKDLDRIKTMKNNSSSVVKSCSDMITDIEINLDLKSEK